MKDLWTFILVLVVVTFLSVLSAVTSYADEFTASFAWTYDVEQNNVIDGFRIFIDDGDTVLMEAIPADARTAMAPFEQTADCHDFYIVAYIGDRQSPYSNPAQWCKLGNAITIMKVETLKVEIIEADSMVIK